VKVVPIPPSRPPSPASRIDTEMYRVLEQVARRLNPGAAVLPSMSTGASDQAQLRGQGIQSYGIGPASTEEDSLNYPGARRRGAPGRVVALSRSSSSSGTRHDRHEIAARYVSSGTSGANRNPKSPLDQRVDEPAGDRQRGTGQSVLGQGVQVHGSTVDPG
jgi:hypothetical protein